MNIVEFNAVTPTWPKSGAKCLLLLKDGSVVYGKRFKFSDIQLPASSDKTDPWALPARIQKGAEGFFGDQSNTIRFADIAGACPFEDIEPNLVRD